MTVLATCATLYGVAGSFSSLLQAVALARAGSAREISIPFIAILTGGHAIWLAYGVGITNLPLIVTDAIGLCCGLVTWITAVRLSGTVDQRQRMRQESASIRLTRTPRSAPANVTASKDSVQ